MSKPIWPTGPLFPRPLNTQIDLATLEGKLVPLFSHCNILQSSVNNIIQRVNTAFHSFFFRFNLLSVQMRIHLSKDDVCHWMILDPDAVFLLRRSYFIDAIKSWCQLALLCKTFFGNEHRVSKCYTSFQSILRFKIK